MNIAEKLHQELNLSLINHWSSEEREKGIKELEFNAYETTHMEFFPRVHFTFVDRSMIIYHKKSNWFEVQ